MKNKKKLIILLSILIIVLLLVIILVINNKDTNKELKEVINETNNIEIQGFNEVKKDTITTEKEYNYDGIVITNINMYNKKDTNFITFDIQNKTDEVFTKRLFLMTLYDKNGIEIINLVCSLDFDLNSYEYTTMRLLNSEFDFNEVTDVGFVLTPLE